jgi:hypoxanthine phosphoribosyltransferase
LSEVKYSWKDVVALVNRVVYQVKKSKVKYDLILAVLRGGAIPAVMISHLIDVDVAAIPAKNYRYAIKDKMGEKKVMVGIPSFVIRTATYVNDDEEWQETINKIKKGKMINQNQIIKTVLIVDEIVDSGETLFAVTEAVRNTGWNFDVAVLIKKEQDVVKVKYYADIVKAEDWVVMPWEVKKEGESVYE